MKLKKLTGMFVAAAIIASYGAAVSIPTSADTSTLVAGASSGYDDIDVPITETEYVGLGSLFGGNFEYYLNEYILFHPDKNINFTLEVSKDSVTGEFPSYISYRNIATLRNYHKRGYSIKFTVNVVDPTTSCRYIVTFSSLDAANLTTSQLNEIKTAGALNFSLYFLNRDKELIIKGHDVLLDDVGFEFDYQITYANFRQLLDASNLITSSVIHSDTLALYNLNNDDIIKDNVNPNNDLIFSINDSNRQGVYVTNIDENVEYFTKSQAKSMVRDLLNSTIGIKNGSVAGVDSDFNKVNNFIDDAVTDIVSDLKTYSTEAELVDAVNTYYMKNKPALINAIVSDIDITEQIEEQLETILGSEVDYLTKAELYDYIEKKAIEEVAEQIETYNTPINNQIVKTVNEALETKIASLKKELQNDIISAITNGKSISEFVDSLRGKDGEKGETGPAGADGKDGINGTNGADGKDGADGTNGKDAYEIAVENGFRGTRQEWLNSLEGEDGQGFEEWAIKNYGSIDNFMSSISFEGWAKKNFGSIDNFVKSITGSAGLSAYELAVQSGYRGSLYDWLSSLQGKDGKSAYEIAVENGYRGTVGEWLESLQGEDGQDGEDGEDGQDGKDGEDGKDAQIVYVNGTYGQVVTQQPEVQQPDDDAKIDYVVINPTGSKPSAGVVNPSTGVAAGIILPAAAIGSVMLVKKNKRKRGRK